MQADPHALPQPPRARRISTSDRLRAALQALGGGQMRIASHRETAWASITFAGTRHTIALAFTGTRAMAAGEAFITALPEHEFTISRQLVADAAVVAVEHAVLPEPRLTVEVELLLVEDC